MKIEQELQNQHQIDLEQKDQQISNLEDQKFQLKRQVTLLEVKLETLQTDFQEQINQLQKQQHASDMELYSNISEGVHANQIPIHKHEAYICIKNELEDLKGIISKRETQIQKLNQELDQLKLDKTQIIQQTIEEKEKLAQQLRQEQTQKDIIEAQLEEMKKEFRARINDLNSSNQGSPNKNILNFNDISQDIDLNKLKQRELQQKILYDRIQHLQQQLTDLNVSSKACQKRLEGQIDTLKKENRDLQNDINKINMENQDKILDERKKYANLNKELKQMEREKLEAEKQLREARSYLMKVAGNKNVINQDDNNQNISQISMLPFQNTASYVENTKNVSELREYSSNIFQQNLVPEEKQPYQPGKTQNQEPNQNQSQLSFNDQNQNKFSTKQFQSQQNQFNQAEKENQNQLKQERPPNAKELKKIKQLKSKLKIANEKIMQLLQEKLLRTNCHSSFDPDSYIQTLKFQNQGQPQPQSQPQHINAQYSGDNSNYYNQQYEQFQTQNPVFFNTIVIPDNEQEQDLVEQLNKHKEKLDNLNRRIKEAASNTYRTYDMNNGYYPISYDLSNK
ncbi:hypothetical protein PPERSA_02432 [Pseudocohnilembus persalinus]|uniref:Uncharacterized protein n=1 Tax=Pseudocohnilembus persalinus TaxID=266149 RepID=A0A0V0QAT0_PSEPJ|nr:hypothetical protein PPERSA_02432 [Pseudocohnilembus persalinus]|eukprot:KRW99320.1 hypothetical protein PPERSA_02432 [Pseudocohnilembus persalinus]